MRINSNTLEVRDKDKVAVFAGNVVVVQGDTTMRSPELMVFYEGEAAPMDNQPQSTSSIKRLEALGEQLDGGNITTRRIRADRDRPITGTRLLREWQGVEQIVTVTQGGFEWQGRPYQSLSAIARAITGTRWNGWVFFGLKNHRRTA
ncbi:MAG: hypothetical protein B7X99_04480 [Rhizobiales bacterium 17-65-6]|nr:MAG: hypothetical protein B7X99_04480 [Rhizobiales bacterium 17-65-6]